MTLTPAEELPCARGCTWPAVDDEEPKPRPARHGTLCNACFAKLHTALGQIPDLITNMRAQIIPGGSGLGDGMPHTSDPTPIPLRADPLDDSDALFAKLVSWSESIGGALHQAQPSVAVWMNFREAQGMRGPVTPLMAGAMAEQLVEWYRVRLEAIAELPFASDLLVDICWGYDDNGTPGVFKLQHYASESKRRVSKRPCPVCGLREVTVRSPQDRRDDVQIECSRCHWSIGRPLTEATADQFEEYARLVR